MTEVHSPELEKAQKLSNRVTTAYKQMVKAKTEYACMAYNLAHRNAQVAHSALRANIRIAYDVDTSTKST